MNVDAGSVCWQRFDRVQRVGTDTAPTPGAVPLAPPVENDPVDLSVVVVFHDMRREAARTLHSLSRSYQNGVADVEYEVIAIDNGSSSRQRLDPAFVESFGPEFHLLDMGDGAPSSPVTALNLGIARARGRNLALMIDGAHVVTPGALHFGLVGLEAYAPAIVATQQWYLGPGQQGDVMNGGYDQAAEDRLFDAIDWPIDGYRLFEIGHFVGDRDWFEGMWESNCIFVTRNQLEQVGGFDEAFSMAGGGYANLDLFERLGSSPEITVATMLGEGSFHQVHGGTTTNQIDPEERRRRVFGYSEHYADVRGRAFRGPGKAFHYVGRFPTDASKRTRSRRMSAEAFGAAAEFDGDGLPSKAIAVPDELRTAFTDAVWRSMSWAQTSWLGHTVRSAPTDLIAYQEAIAGVRPDWIIEAGTGDGGRTLFLASVCEMVGHGAIISIDETLGDDLPEPSSGDLRPRAATRPASDTRRVAELVGDGDVHGLLVLGERADRHRTTAQFDAYERYVRPGSLVIVTDTVVNGHPVWPAFGPGPAEAVKRILRDHGDFVVDPSMEKYSLSFDTGGYLRRVR